MLTSAFLLVVCYFLCYILGMDAEQKDKKEKLVAKLQQFRLMDDDFMTKFFENDIERTQFVL